MKLGFVAPSRLCLGAVFLGLSLVPVVSNATTTGYETSGGDTETMTDGGATTGGDTETATGGTSTTGGDTETATGGTSTPGEELWVLFSEPADGDEVPTMFTVRLDASEDAEAIDLSVDGGEGIPPGCDGGGAPCEFPLNLSLGSHTLTATALRRTDTVSETITVSVVEGMATDTDAAASGGDDAASGGDDAAGCGCEIDNRSPLSGLWSLPLLLLAGTLRRS